MIRPVWNRWDWNFDPFADIRLLERQMNRLFRDAHGRGTDYPSLNFWSNEDEVLLEFELPGATPEDFDLSVTDDVVTVSGARRDPMAEDSATAHRQERSFGPFSRTLQLPFAVNADNVVARYENGILRVTLPRREETKSKKIAIQAT